MTDFPPFEKFNLYNNMDNKDELISSLQSEVERLKKEKDETQKLCEFWIKRYDQFKSDNDRLNKEKEEYKNHINLLRTNLDYAGTLGNTLKSENEKLKEEIERLKSSVSISFEGSKPLEGKMLDILDETYKKSLKSETKRGIEEKKEECSHENTKLQNIRCNICSDCGEIIETDV